MILSSSKSFGYAASIGCMAIALCLAGAAYSQQNGTALVLDVSPPEGGTVNLSPGVHTYDRYAELRLTAVPNPGYQFVYWLGDVASAAESTTMVFLDSPKIVIAVFERSKFALAEFEEGPQVSRGRGGLIPSAGDYSRTGGEGGGGRRPSRPRFHRPPEPEEDFPVPEEDENDIPVPEGGDDIPVPVPEPATVVFIFTGIFALAKRRCRRA